ncbi:MAG: TonB-dependent receptor, partial [Bacteroidales bacterium]|nr:TonB-dependent receptor [Bacteroidales bacterium]
SDLAMNVLAQNQEVTIIAPYQPSIGDAVKINAQPVMPDTTIALPPMSYSITSRVGATDFEITPVKPALIDIKIPHELHRNYLRAGFGNYTTPYFELFTNSLSSDKYAIGFHARHLSSAGNIDDYATSGFSHNNVSLYASRYLRKLAISGKLDYQRDVVHYYGFKPDDDTLYTIADDELRQRYSMIGGEFSLATIQQRRSNKNFDAGVHFYHLNNLNETSELNIGTNANFNSQTQFLDFVQNQELGIDLALDYYHNADSLNSGNALAMSLTPYLRLHMGYLQLRLGVTGALAADSTSNFFVYPDVRADYQIIPDYLTFYAAVTGGLHRNSFKEIINENPWADPLFPLGFTSTSYDIKGGVTGKIDQLFNYNFSVSYASIDNMLYYNNDIISAYSQEVAANFGNKFTGIYDDTQVTAVSLEMGYSQGDRFDVLLRGAYRDYKPATQAKAWHKPKLEVALLAHYNMGEKLTVSGELYYNSKTYVQTRKDKMLIIDHNKAYVDLNLGAEYHFSKKIAAFVQCNNLTSTRYYRYYQYPSQRINAMGGFTFSF